MEKMGYQSEAELEERLLQKLEMQGYERIVVGDYDSLVNNFRKELNRLNHKTLKHDLTDSEFKRVMNTIDSKTVYASAKQLRDKFTLELDDGKEIYMQLFSEDPEKNHYQVSNQITVKGTYVNRYDVTILINGLPLVQIELKRSGVDIKEAINQIDRYRIHSYKGLFHYIQLFVVSNSVETRYFSNTDEKRIMKSLTFYWTDEANKRLNKLDEFAESFLDKARLTKMISKYMIIKASEKVVMVMRPYQIYATEAILNQALFTNKGGYVWHTTGSGKTLTSWKTAMLLSKEPSIKKVFFLVDRADLDDQTMREFNSFEDGCVDATDKTYVLAKQIKDPNKKFIISTIQKMAIAVKTEHYKKDLEAYKDEKVIFIIDECHRSQFGKMHNDVKKFFTNAQYFGFTGTPRFTENKPADGRTTADIFGERLHSYMIKEAIFDRNVLGFNIEYISTYRGQYDIEDTDLVEAIDRQEVLESPERVSLIANHIVDHHTTKTRISGNKYTAIFATSSIPMLVKYYDEFKKIKHNLKIAAVFSFGANEDLDGKDEHSRDQLERIIQDYNAMFDTNFSTDTFAAYDKDIQKRLQLKKIPEIDLLLVVNMHLTGFDSKPLNTLYVDKNLEWHGLLQAFSRTNRVERETKQFGNIVCYRNLKKATDDALRLFSGGGNIDGVLLKPFEHYIKEFEKQGFALRGICPTVADVDDLQSEEDQAKFVVAFRELSKTLLTLETFIDFEWDMIKCMTQQEYLDYKSRYQTIYDIIKNQRQANKTSILLDIDFAIEIIETDRINVAYIMNLLRNVDLKNPTQKQKDIEHIKKELLRSDSPELKKKIDLIQAFLNEVVIGMSPNSDMDESWAEYEQRKRNEEIEAFAKEHNIDSGYLKNAIAEYEFSGDIDRESIRDQIKLPLLKARKMMDVITSFIIENCNRFQ